VRITGDSSKAGCEAGRQEPLATSYESATILDRIEGAAPSDRRDHEAAQHDYTCTGQFRVRCAR
jgi:hypothetical protein